MELVVREIHEAGNAFSEYVKLYANKDTNLSKFILTDTSYFAGATSNIFRHTYWFPDMEVKAGDTIYVNTRKGNDVRLSYIDLFWNSDHAIWNDTGDTAYLIKIENYEMFSTYK